MVAAYAEKPSTTAAIRSVFGMSLSELERGYTAFVKQQVAAMPVLAEPPAASFSELEKARRERPGDAEAAAGLAYAYLTRGAAKEAIDLAKKALELKPKHQFGDVCVVFGGEGGDAETRRRGDAGRKRGGDRRGERGRKNPPRRKRERAGGEGGAGSEARSIALLEACLDRKAPEPLVLICWPILKLKAQQYDAAAELFSLGERLDPSNPKWTAALPGCIWRPSASRSAGGRR